MKRRRQKVEEQPIEMQMGPMIDMVFLLLVFFMVTAKPIPQESDISIGLPGELVQEEVVDFPDELKLQIAQSGQVILNEQSIDAPSSKNLPELLKTLYRFKQAADNNKSEALVTLDPADQVQHQRVVDVLNACAKAGITGVSFTP